MIDHLGPGGVGGAPTEPADPLVDLAARIKAELRRRFERGERPTVREYLDRYPELEAADERVISLVYEEFCLLEERGEPPDPDSFCDRYEPWRDSLASQLRYHRLLSQAVATPPRPKYPKPGDHFHDFELRSILGEGGAARVYLAREEPLGGREVALKVSTGRGAEASIQGRLDHKHIVPVWSVHDDPATGFRGLCMPYRPGMPLDQVIRRVEPAARPRRALILWNALLNVAAIERRERPSGPGWQGFPTRGTYAEGVAWVVGVLARALAYAHGQGVLHRDVKPANVLLTIRDGPQLLDFNLAHDPNAPERAEAALRGGTLPYMAPEQLEAFLDSERWNQVGPGADLYALGLLLRELLTGRRPEAHDPDLPLPRAINELLDRRASAWPSLRRENPAIPHGLDAIVARCLAHDPAHRYQSASDLADDLLRFVEHRPLRVAVNPSRPEVAGNWARRHRVGLVLVAAGLLAVIPTARAITWLQIAGNANTASSLVLTGFDRLRNGDLVRARESFEGALALDPRLYSAYKGLGDLAFAQKDYSESLRLYDQAVELARTATPRLPDTKLAAILLDRAGIAIASGRQAQARLTPAAFATARGRFGRALEDLATADRLTKDFPRRIAALGGQAEIGLGDAASATDDYPEAVRCFELAVRRLRVARRRYPEDADIGELLEAARQRLAADRPRLDRTPSATPHPKPRP